jgi:D-3-phosphoglycerate dehydrogenase / 2-oxoglutarate reductase
MRILVADKLPAYAVERLSEAGHEVTVDKSLKDAALLDALVATGAEVVVVRSTKITAEMFDAGSLKLVVRAGAGTNTIAVPHATTLGVHVANCPGKNSLAVAELAMGLMLSMDRRIPDACAELRAGKWNKAEYSKSRGVAGLTMAVAGAGQIGRAVAKRALAFDMKVLAWDAWKPAVDAAVALGCEACDDLMEMVARADVITIHLPATAETKGMLNDDFFAAMKDGAFLINTSRAGLVDEAALLRAIDAKGIRAGVDVFADEISGGTGEFTSALIDSPSVWATPHVGASTTQAQEAVANEVVRVIMTFADEGQIPNHVNPDSLKG